MDLVFAFETSNAIEADTLDELKIFLTNMLKSYDIGEKKVRIALINFSGKQEVVIDLENGINENAINEAIKKITKLGMF